MVLSQFDEEVPEPIPIARNAADGPDRPPRGWNRAATHAEHQPAPSRPTGRETAAAGCTHDLRQDMDNRAGHTHYKKNTLL